MRTAIIWAALAGGAVLVTAGIAQAGPDRLQPWVPVPVIALAWRKDVR